VIHTATQLKALVRNMSHGDSAKAQLLLRSYAIERFLARLAQSEYREKIILKGGALVAAMLGLARRSTMDMDATVKQHPLSAADAGKIVVDIIEITLDDGISFVVQSVETIMDEADYSGIRVKMEATLDTMRIPLKLDFSTGDVITPKEVLFSYPLLFENSTLPVYAYNLETLLAEKLETILARGAANTRMRDFYDVYALDTAYASTINRETLQAALASTCEIRGSAHLLRHWEQTLAETQADPEIVSLWERYRQKFDYAAGIGWDAVMGTVHAICRKALHPKGAGSVGRQPQ